MAKEIRFLSEAMKSIFNDRRTSDFRLICKNQTFYVHELILNTRSEYFRGLTEGDSQEAENGLAHIDDVEPNILKAVLQGMYYDDYDGAVEWGMASFYYERDVLTLAERLKVRGLDRICVKNLEDEDETAEHAALVEEYCDGPKQE